MTFPSTTITTPPQSLAEVIVNEAFETIEHQSVYGKKHATTSGLTWGYYGGRWGGFSVADGTLSASASSTNYIVVLRSSGVISISTSATNWNDTTSYARVYKLTTSGSAVTAVEDHRSGPSGVHGTGAAAGAGTELKGLTFTSDTASQTDADPGNGKLRWNNATQSSATTLFVDNQTADAVSLTTLWSACGPSGTLFIQQGDDSTRWQMWKWTATPIDGTGYRKFTVSLLAAGTAIQDAKTVYIIVSPGIPDGPLEAIVIAASDETTALTTGTAKVTFRMPYAFKLTDVRGSLTVAQTSGSILTVDVNEAGTSILSTKLTIDNTEKTSTTAATAAVISDANLADDAEMTVDIDQVGDGTAKGLKVVLIGRRV